VTTTTDLRPAFAAALKLRTFMPPEDDDTGPSPADDADKPVGVGGGDAAGEGDEQEPAELTDDEVKNPRLKELSDEAAKYRRLRREEKEKREAAEARVAELEKATPDEAVQAENRSLKLELAWERATRTVAWTDSGADGAWKLAQDQLPAVLNDDGTVDATRLGEVINDVLRRYPFLVAQEEEPPPADAFPHSHPSGPATNGKKVVLSPATDRAVLERKFPALRSRR
jgi:hypothetical protein